MFRVVEGNTLGLADVDEFINLVKDPPADLRNFFDQGTDIFVSRAPGRLDVMGGIADYSGSLVLQMPIAEATFAAVQRTDDRTISIASFRPDSPDILEFQMAFIEIENNSNYEDARRYFSQKSRDHWASYAAGVFLVLHRELGVEFDSGARILISSRVPIGKGVSSSAALEIATMQAVCAAFSINIGARELALLCQKVENLIVGAPCGVMDQISSNCAVENALLALLCQPAEIRGTIEIPDEIEFWGIDSGVSHSVAGADYGSVRTGAFMGYRIIANKSGLASHIVDGTLAEVIDDRWGGYLANVSPEEYERDLVDKIPASLDGAQFLKEYGGTTDPVTTVDASRVYQVKAPTEHAIYESSRVRKFANLLDKPMTDQNIESLGQLMFASHESYSACGLTEPRTDRIVELIRQNRSLGLFGARITGGGSGGTVVVLAKRNSESAANTILDKLEQETCERPYIFRGSSPGASRFGHLRLAAA